MKLLEDLAQHPDLFRVEMHGKGHCIHLAQGLYESGSWKAFIEVSPDTLPEWWSTHKQHAASVEHTLLEAVKASVSKYARKSMPSSDSAPGSKSQIGQPLLLGWLLKERHVKLKLTQYVLASPDTDLMVHRCDVLQKALPPSFCQWGTSMLHLRKFLQSKGLSVRKSQPVAASTCDKHLVWPDCPCLDEVLMPDTTDWADILCVDWNKSNEHQYLHEERIWNHSKGNHFLLIC